MSRLLRYTLVFITFLSTLPARGATSIFAFSPGARSFLSTLPARGATVKITPHAKPEKFLSTLPARGATQPAAAGDLHRVISIHAPREGSDQTS